MTEYDMTEFSILCQEYLDSSIELRKAAELCEDDPIKQEMVAFIAPDFEDVQIRSEGIQTFLKNDQYPQYKSFIISEMKSITKKNLEMARKIREKLSPLVWN